MGDVVAEGAVGTQIARFELLGDAQHVLQHKHLTVGGTAGTDADGGHGDELRDFGSQRRRYLLEHDGEAASLVEHLCVVDQSLGLVGLGGADDIGAELVDALRCQTEMTHDGDARREDTRDGFQHLFPTLELDGVGAGLFHDADGGGQSLLGVALVGAERHVDDDEGTTDGTLDRGGVDNHLVKGDGQRGIIALHDVGSGVADQDNIYLGAVEQLGHGIVVSRQHGDFLATVLHIL